MRARRAWRLLNPKASGGLEARAAMTLPGGELAGAPGRKSRTCRAAARLTLAEAASIIRTGPRRAFAARAGLFL